MLTIEVTVRYSSQAYNCRSGKTTASSTSSHEAAARRLGEKLFGDRLRGLRKVGYGESLYDEVWAIDAAEARKVPA